MNKPYVSVEQQMEDKIATVVIENQLSRREAAEQILWSKDGWYVQTPEGEYLLKVIEGRGMLDQTTQHDDYKLVHILPKNLTEAIENGIANISSAEPATVTLARYVKDFLAQKFSVHTLSDDEREAGTAIALFKTITGEK